MQRETLVSHPPGRLASQSKAMCHDLHHMYPPTPCGLRLLLREAQQLRVGIIPISFHFVSVSAIRRHAGMSCMTAFCQQKRLPLLLGKYHLSANLSTALQIFVLFREKSNFYFRNMYLPLSTCIYIPLYIQYLAGIFQTQPLKQQKGCFLNPHVSLANSLYPSILGRKKLSDETPVPFSQAESAGDCYFYVVGRQVKGESGLSLPTPSRRNGECFTESTASSLDMVGHT